MLKKKVLNYLLKLEEFKKKLKIQICSFGNSFVFIRDDRGAFEYVARSDAVWIKYCSEINLPATAFSIFDCIYWPNKKSMIDDVKTFKHELSHVDDFKKLGYIYDILYRFFNIKFGYLNNPFEIKARSKEK